MPPAKRQKVSQRDPSPTTHEDPAPSASESEPEAEETAGAVEEVKKTFKDLVRDLRDSPCIYFAC